MNAYSEIARAPIPENIFSFELNVAKTVLPTVKEDEKRGESIFPSPLYNFIENCLGFRVLSPP